MAKALEYPVIFKTLLDGGYICEVQSVLRNYKYELYRLEIFPQPNKYVGHITPKQFDELVSQGIIGWNGMPNMKDKSGAVSISYGLLKEKDGEAK